MKSKKQKK